MGLSKSGWTESNCRLVDPNHARYRYATSRFRPASVLASRAYSHNCSLVNLASTFTDTGPSSRSRWCGVEPSLVVSGLSSRSARNFRQQGDRESDSARSVLETNHRSSGHPMDLSEVLYLPCGSYVNSGLTAAVGCLLARLDPAGGWRPGAGQPGESGVALFDD